MNQIKTSSLILGLTGIACSIFGIVDQIPVVLYLGIGLLLFSSIRFFLLTRLTSQPYEVINHDNDSVMRYLKQNRVLYIDMIEIYKQGNCDVLYDERDGILLYDHTSKYHLASAITKEAVVDILRKIPTDFSVFVAHDAIFEEAFDKEYTFAHKLYSYNHVYERKAYFVLKESNVNLRYLDMTHLTLVKEWYTISQAFPSNYIENRIQAGMLGAFIDEELVGFIGVHETGCLGMLEVSETHRKKGVATVLQCAMSNEILNKKKNATVYSQVNAENIASLKLQEKTHFTKASNTCIWYYKNF